MSEQKKKVNGKQKSNINNNNNNNKNKNIKKKNTGSKKKAINSKGSIQTNSSKKSINTIELEESKKEKKIDKEDNKNKELQENKKTKMKIVYDENDCKVDNEMDIDVEDNILQLRKNKINNEIVENKRKNKRNSNIIIYIFCFIFLCLIIFSVTKIFVWSNDNHKTKKTIKDIHKTVKIKIDNGYKIDFGKLRNMNSDVVAWIKIKNTSVDYPVVKANNNDFYLNHSFDKSYNNAGWIFMNNLNEFDGTDKNITIFGHARLDGSMFGSVKNMLTSEWQSNPDNYDISIFTDGEETKYRVFSTYIIKVEEYYLKNTFNNNQEFQIFIESLKSRSNFNYNTEVSENDQILTLSTCDTKKDYRVVVHAIKL